MKVLELFAGTRSIGKEFEKRGHTVLSVDYDPQFKDCLNMDVNDLTVLKVIELLGGHPDVIWASPDCTTYSIAAISHHRQYNGLGELMPKSNYAALCDNTNWRVIRLIALLKPKFYFIENPRGGMRKMGFVNGLPRYTVTYCQYGDKRMKPTDIWTNHPNPNFKPMCHNGDTCHERAPRGSRHGTQGLDKVDRSRIPEELARHIVDICEEVK